MSSDAPEETSKARWTHADTTTERLEIFSDGVIAIAITLLVLDIKVPDHVAPGDLFHTLADAWPSYVAFVLSFVTIGLVWVAHHSMFESIAHTDRGLLFTNLALLLGIAFLPFPTALLAEFAREGGSNSHQAAAIYSATMALIGVAFLMIWRHLDRHPELLMAGFVHANIKTSMRRALVGPVVYTLSIGLAFISAIACFVVYALIAVYFAWGPSYRALVTGFGKSDEPEPEPALELDPEQEAKSVPEPEPEPEPELAEE